MRNTTDLRTTEVHGHWWANDWQLQRKWQAPQHLLLIPTACNWPRGCSAEKCQSVRHSPACVVARRSSLKNGLEWSRQNTKPVVFFANFRRWWTWSSCFLIASYFSEYCISLGRKLVRCALFTEGDEEESIDFDYWEKVKMFATRRRKKKTSNVFWAHKQRVKRSQHRRMRKETER